MQHPQTMEIKSSLVQTLKSSRSDQTFYLQISSKEKT